MLRPESIKYSQTPTNITISLICLNTIQAEDIDVDIDDTEVVISAHPYVAKFKFYQGLMSDGPEYKLMRQDQEIVLQIGKQIYKEEFTFDDPYIV